MDTIKLTKKKMTAYQTDFFVRMNAIEVDAHWFRRVFHTFAASFLFYYLLPDDEWINLGKLIIPIIIILCIIIIEYQRIRGFLNHTRFFGLRNYEKKRPASYLYFGLATLLLFFLFPQQIVIPCLLCASFSDPIIGESRYYLGKKRAYIIGFIVSMFFFLITWYRVDWWILILVSLFGATTVVISETKKLKLIDDDFMIQILPAILLWVMWQIFITAGIDILPSPIIYPL